MSCWMDHPWCPGCRWDQATHDQQVQMLSQVTQPADIDHVPECAIVCPRCGRRITVRACLEMKYDCWSEPIDQAEQETTP